MLMAAGAATVATVAMPPSAYAQEQMRSFNVAAQALSRALLDLGTQAGLSISAPIEATRGRTSRPVSGEMTTRQALEQLLEGSGLSFEFVNPSAVRVYTSTASDQPSSGAESANFVDPMDTIAEIIVTAQKRSERLIDIPQSVSVVTAARLQTLDATQFRDFANTVPALSFTTLGAGLNQISLRGVTAGSDVSPTVAIYVDEVPYGTATPFAGGAGLALDLAPLDLERVEILRGPQGTLYGASSMGGLLKYVTTMPSTAEAERSVRVGLSSTREGGISSYGSVTMNAPLTDKAALRASGFYSHDGGYIDNATLGRSDVNRSDIYGGRLDLLLTPTQNASVRITAMAQSIERDGSATADYSLAGDPINGELTQLRRVTDPFDQDFRLASVTVNYDFGPAALTSISSFQNVKTASANDLSMFYGGLLPGGGAGYSGVRFTALNDTDRLTQEVRLVSGASDRVEWLFGGFYTDEDSTSGSVTLPVNLAGESAAPLLYANMRPSAYREIAAFGNVTVHITPQFDVTGGLRYAESELRTSNTSTGMLGGAPELDTRARENIVTYLANARYRFSDRSTAYFRYATGYRPGGPNFTVTNPITGLPNAPTTFASDSLQSFELGYRIESAGARLSVDAAAYYIDWKDIQVQVYRAPFGALINAEGGASVRGGEVTLTARPADALTITGAFAIQDAQLDEADAGVGGGKGERLPNVPRFTGVLDADYSFSSSFQPRIGTTLRYVSDRPAGFDASVGVPQYELPDYLTWDVRAGIQFGSFDAQLFVRNLLDERGELSASTIFGNARLAIMQPRTIGVSLRTAF